jgi:hypothetical protein
MEGERFRSSLAWTSQSWRRPGNADGLNVAGHGSVQAV